MKRFNGQALFLLFGVFFTLSVQANCDMPEQYFTATNADDAVTFSHTELMELGEPLYRFTTVDENTYAVVQVEPGMIDHCVPAGEHIYFSYAVSCDVYSYCTCRDQSEAIIVPEHAGCSDPRDTVPSPFLSAMEVQSLYSYLPDDIDALNNLPETIIDRYFCELSETEIQTLLASSGEPFLTSRAHINTLGSSGFIVRPDTENDYFRMRNCGTGTLLATLSSTQCTSHVNVDTLFKNFKELTIEPRGEVTFHLLHPGFYFACTATYATNDPFGKEAIITVSAVPGPFADSPRFIDEEGNEKKATSRGAEETLYIPVTVTDKYPRKNISLQILYHTFMTYIPGTTRFDADGDGIAETTLADINGTSPIIESEYSIADEMLPGERVGFFLKFKIDETLISGEITVPVLYRDAEFGGISSARLTCPWCSSNETPDDSVPDEEAGIPEEDEVQPDADKPWSDNAATDDGVATVDDTVATDDAVPPTHKSAGCSIVI